MVAVLTWQDFNFDLPFYDLETGIVIMFEGPNLKNSDPVLDYEPFKDRNLVFLIFESPFNDK